MAAANANRNQYFSFSLDGQMVEVYGESLHCTLSYENNTARALKIRTRSDKSEFTVASSRPVRIIKADAIIRGKSLVGTVYNSDCIIITTLK